MALEKKVEASKCHISVKLHLAHDLAFKTNLVQFPVQLIRGSLSFLDQLSIGLTALNLQTRSRG